MLFAPPAVSEENFQQAWRYGTRKYYWAKKASLVRRCTAPLAQFLFFWGFMILVYGAALNMVHPTVTAFLSVEPRIVALWDQFSAIVFAYAETEAQRLMACAGVLYGIPFALILPIAAAIHLFYHPMPQKRTGDKAQDAFALRSMAKHAQFYARQKEHNLLPTCQIFAGVLIGILFFGYILYCLNVPQMRQLILNDPTKAAVRVLILTFATVFSYRIVNFPLLLLLRLIALSHVQNGFAENAENYHISLSKETGSVQPPK